MAQTKYTPELGEMIAEMVAQGTPHATAAQAAGVCRDTYYRWLSENPSFSTAIEQKKAQAVHDRVSRILEAGRKGVWQADAWWLERRRPEQFMLRQKLDTDSKFIIEIRTVSQDNRQVIDLEPEQLRLESPGAPLDMTDSACEGED